MDPFAKLHVGSPRKTFEKTTPVKKTSLERSNSLLGGKAISSKEDEGQFDGDEFDWDSES